MSHDIGGISKTVNYKGYRMDIGGHRFFSKSDVVMNWWLNILPIENTSDSDITITYQNKSRKIEEFNDRQNSGDSDLVMLIRNRKSRILFLRKFFNYPLNLSKDTLFNLGLSRVLKIFISYLHAKTFPIKKERNLEEFFINRFGKVLYRTFFKAYTEKVWGIPCNQIGADWGAQRIKGLSILKAIQHSLKKILGFNSRTLTQKNVETSLIERFLYPKYGPGQLWEEVARQIQERGGELHLDTTVRNIHISGEQVTAIEICDSKTGTTKVVEGEYFFSTMPVKELIIGLQTEVPFDIKRISEGLIYRDFITVGLLVEKLSIKDKDKSDKLIKDNWIYVQEADVFVGRIQIFNNWSPYLVKDPSKVWLGLEYFCYDSDELWQKSKEEMADLAISELIKIGFIAKASEVLDFTVVKVPKTYPAYFGTYSEFDQVREYLDKYENLYLIGRNGMHRYNNQDHSMLTAITAVNNIKNGVKDKSNIWAVNTEQNYHEEVKPTARSFPNQSAVRTLRQFVSYLFTGGAATIVDVLVFSILVTSGMWYVSALCISFLFGVSTNFLLSRRLVFNVYWKNWLAQFTVFTIVSLNSLLANLGLMQLLINDLSWNATTARLISAASVAILSFTGHKLYSFGSHNQNKEEQTI